MTTTPQATTASQTSTALVERPQPTPVRHVVPALDVLSREGAWTLLVDLPGVRPDDLSVEVERGVLTVQAPRHDRPGLGWKRRVRLPDGIDPEAVRAALRHGVLTVDLPARAEVAARSIPVTVD